MIVPAQQWLHIIDLQHPLVQLLIMFCPISVPFGAANNRLCRNFLTLCGWVYDPDPGPSGGGDGGDRVHAAPF